jgi:hypothetical protein
MRQPITTRTLLLSLSVAVALIIPTTPALATTGTCPNEQLRHESDTNPTTGVPYSAELPECRAYELVSPAEKNAQHLFGGDSAPDGNAEIMRTVTALPGSPTGATSAYVARRAPGGWATAPLAPANDNPDNQNALDLGEVGSDFSTVFLGDDNDLVPGDGDAYFLNLFAVGEEGSLAWVSQGPTGGVETPPKEEPEYEARLGGASVSLSHVVFEVTYGELLPEDTHGYGSEIYDRVGGATTELVGLLPDESVPVCGASLGEQPGSAIGGYYPTSVAADTAVSAEGTAVFFRSPDPGATSSCPAETPPQLYVRINDERTAEISAPAQGVTDPHGEQEAHYASSTPNGDRVFFTSEGALTANADTDSDTTEDLYECEIIETAGKPACSLTDLSSAGLTDPDGSQVQGVVDVSENGEVVYFVAKGKLTAQATSGALNLYASDGGHISYIAALGVGDSRTWSGKSSLRNARVTPDGAHLLFSSSASLTGYATNGDQELYLYDLSGGSLTCISCGAEGGAKASTNAELLGDFGGTFSQGVHAPQSNLSDDGETVFFDSPESLAGVDTHGISNVYEWHDGTVTLISPPGEYPAYFDDASPDGSNVFFETHDVLVGQDQDGGDNNVYDARVDGGYPAPPQKEAGCSSNETCKNAGTSLSTLTPASLTSTGDGNILPPPPPPKTVTTVTKSKPLTNAQKLAAALKACKKEKAKKRQACEAGAHRKYGPRPKAKKAKKQ